MKKKVRDIVVDNINYVWIVNETQWPEIQLKVWRSGEKKHPIIHEKMKGGSITPKLVSEKIKMYEATIADKN